VYFPGPCSIDLITLHHKRARKRKKKRFCYLKATNLSEEVPIRVKKPVFGHTIYLFGEKNRTEKRFFFGKTGKFRRKPEMILLAEKKSDF